MNKRVSENLKLQLFCAVLSSLFVGIIIFCASFLLGNTLLDKTIYGHSFAERMADQQFSKLQDYVEDESISLHNLQRLNVWCSRGEKVYLAIYQDDELIYESHISDKQEYHLNTNEFSPDMEDPDNEYFLTLCDDTKVRTFLYYYAGDAFYFWMTAFSGLVAFLAFSICFVVLINRKISYITLLKQELDILSGGQMEYPVTITGNDELSELALGIDQMRRSIMKHQEAEKQIRSANSELITAMSHDLRTPLTSLLVYLEIIQRKKYTDEEQMHNLISKSVEQTMRIKHMANKLFEYSLAYATEWESVDMETTDADKFFHQILGDYAYALESNGMNVETEFSETSAKIKCSPELLRRSLDNLYSNLLKYADPHKTIWISYQQKDQDVFISIVNGIRTDHKKTESTSIGLITCQRIIEYHGGCFTTSDSGESFHVTVSIPRQDYF